MKHGHKAPLPPRGGVRPGVAAGSGGVSVKVKDLDNAFPDALALEDLFDRGRLNPGRVAMVEVKDSSLECYPVRLIHG